jgi:hypothetical protein
MGVLSRGFVFPEPLMNYAPEGLSGGFAAGMSTQIADASYYPEALKPDVVMDVTADYTAATPG